MEEELISAVAQRPALYDKSSDNYSNRTYIAKQWAEIGEELGQEGDFMRKRWTRLRDYFQRNHRQMLAFDSGETNVKPKKWFHYDTMLFLIPYLNIKKLNFNNSEEDSYCNIEFDVDAIAAHAEASPAVSVASVSAASTLKEERPICVLSDDPAVSLLHVQGLDDRRKRKYHEERESLLSGFNMDVKPTFSEFGASFGKDEDELYCLSLAPKMRMLNTLAKLECQIEINSILIKHIRQSRLHE